MNWTVRKGEHRRTDAFELWCWRWLLRVPWIARKSNQSILKEINPENSLEGLKLKFQNFGHLIWRTNSFEKSHMLGKLRAGGEEGNKGLDGWMAWSTHRHASEQALGGSEGQGSLVCCSPRGCKESDMTERHNWTERIQINLIESTDSLTGRNVQTDNWRISRR